MAKIVVAGLINIETTVRVDAFPIDYQPARYPFNGVSISVSGVGLNIAKALYTLGNDVHLLSLIGHDELGALARKTLQDIGLTTEGVLPVMDETAQSVIMYDGAGRRMINVDLKDIQERSYPTDTIDLTDADLVVACNINFARPLLTAAHQAELPIATDVHDIANYDDEYNRDFMAAANILFLSDERLPDPPPVAIEQIQQRYQPEIIVIGMGHKGVLYAALNKVEQMPAVHIRPIVNTIGAGDALFSAFNHVYLKGGSVPSALAHAIRFAAYKIGEKGAASGFLTEERLLNLKSEF